MLRLRVRADYKEIVIGRVMVKLKMSRRDKTGGCSE